MTAPGDRAASGPDLEALRGAIFDRLTDNDVGCGSWCNDRRGTCQTIRAHAADIAADAAANYVRDLLAAPPGGAEAGEAPQGLCTHGSDDGEPCWLPEDHDGAHDFTEPRRPGPICCDYKWTAMTQAARRAYLGGTP